MTERAQPSPIEGVVGLIFLMPWVLLLAGPVAYWIGAGALMVAYTVAFWWPQEPRRESVRPAKPTRVPNVPPPPSPPR